MSKGPVGLLLSPLDTLFFRDGRPFDASTRVTSGLPNPQTLAGALRTALLARHTPNRFDFARFSRLRRDRPRDDPRGALEALHAPGWVIDARFRGPFLALSDGSRTVPLLTQPATLARDKRGNWRRATPLGEHDLPGWEGRGRRPLWWDGEPDKKADGGFLTLEGVSAFLDGRPPGAGEAIAADDLYDHDARTGIELDTHTLTSVMGGIYGISLLALRPAVEKGKYGGWKVGLYAEAHLGEDAPAGGLFPGLIPLGGEGRYIGARPVEAVAWPGRPLGGKALWLLATPAFVRHHGDLALPDSLRPETVRAAASGAPVAVSGWDVARGGPRPTRFAVPAGSVYFVEGDDEPADGSLCADQEDVAQGWGFALPGRWNDA